MKTRHWILVGLLVVIGGIGFLWMMWLFLGAGGYRSADVIPLASHGRRVGLVRLVGPIYDAEPTVSRIETFAEDGGIRALVVRIDSPGGGVAASQEIYDALGRARDEGKPIVASMGSMAASGGYYVACGADTIVANPGTVTGSIGVIMTFPMYFELIQKIGLDFEVIKTGEHKDIGSPSRPMSDEERRLLHEVLDDVYGQFVDVVCDARGLRPESVRELADGRIFSGRQAAELGLVDELGDLDRAVHLAAEMAGISGDPVVVEPRERRPGLIDLLTGLAEGAIHGGAEDFRLEYRAFR
jgi:protease-4